MKNVVLMGATGSIGENTLSVLRKHPDKLRLIGIAAHEQSHKLAAIAKEFKVQNICIYDNATYIKAKESSLFNENQKLSSGETGLTELATLEDADIVLFGLSGTLGLKPALAALSKGTNIALANKEILVLGGQFLTAMAQKTGAKILPIDSEHSGVFQCLQGKENTESIQKIILTASGGYFRDWPIERLREATPEHAIKHPNWSMGPKITVDCATMANKGLELIEAHWLFNLSHEKLDAIIHQQSLIHAFVQFTDGSLLAQLAPPSMTFPIQYALLYPERHPSCLLTIPLERALCLELAPIDPARYPAFFLAKDAIKQGGSLPEAFNAANEVAVQAFLKHQIPFLAISEVIEETLQETHFTQKANTLDEALHIDQLARQFADNALKKYTTPSLKP